jgi:Flp pilus assembly pilin Flp
MFKWQSNKQGKRKGQALPEYALSIALIAIVGLATLQLLGVNIGALFVKFGGQIGNITTTMPAAV